MNIEEITKALEVAKKFQELEICVDNSRRKVYDKPPFVIIRSSGSGVWAAHIVEKWETPSGTSVKLTGAIRLWRWYGGSLSQIAVEAVKQKSDCKFGVPVDVEVSNVLEIIDTTPEAEKNIKNFPSWRV